MISNNLIEDNFRHYNQLEMQNHVINCTKKNLFENCRRHIKIFENEEEEECKINQHLMGMKELFRVHMVKV